MTGLRQRDKVSKMSIRSLISGPLSKDIILSAKNHLTALKKAMLQESGAFAPVLA